MSTDEKRAFVIGVASSATATLLLILIFRKHKGDLL
jgi:hypothetical protein